MYWNTKEYMSDHLVKPVLKRADSVKQIGNAVLENPITTFAAERLDGALTAGDKFVDKYLIPIDGEPDQTDGKRIFILFFCKFLPNVYYTDQLNCFSEMTLGCVLQLIAS